MPNRAPFFVISGADGVGKSTAIELCRNNSAGTGIAIHWFHHVLDKMPDSSPPTDKEPSGKREPKHQRHWFGKLLPQWLKMLISSSLDELKYRRSIKRHLEQSAKRGEIAVSDRYVYDRHISLSLRRRPLVQRLAVRLSCILMRRPTVTYVLVDEPERIRKRKPELTVKEIECYQTGLLRICRRMRAPVELIEVDSRPPEAVASDLLGRIISATTNETSATVSG